MSNWIDRVDEWIDRMDSETFGEYYGRILLTVLYVSFAMGVTVGLVFGAMAGDFAVHHVH